MRNNTWPPPWLRLLPWRAPESVAAFAGFAPQQGGLRGDLELRGPGRLPRESPEAAGRRPGADLGPR
eukprot:5457029-Alexandrium_andersonii.AAC.1